MIKRFINKKSLSVRESAETLKKITSGNKPKIKMTADKKQVDFDALRNGTQKKTDIKKPDTNQTSLFEEAVIKEPITKNAANDEQPIDRASNNTETTAEDSSATKTEANNEPSIETNDNKKDIVRAKKPFLKAVTSIISTDDEPENEPEERQNDKKEAPQIIKFENLKKDSSSEKNVSSLSKKSEEKKRPKKPKLIASNPKKGLHICNLGKSYGDKPAVRDISMVVNQGEAVGLLGPNGAGKTTSF